jgi:hypothetical protein
MRGENRIRRLLLAPAAAFLCCASVLAQETKTLLLDRPVGNDPIRVTRVMDGTTELKATGNTSPIITLGRRRSPLAKTGLRDLSFTIKNVSNQTITYLEISCPLFETADWQKEFAAHSTPANAGLGQASNVVGWRPEYALYLVRLGRTSAPDSTRRPAFELAPGQEFTILLENPEDYPALRTQVEARQPMSTITACDADMGNVFFTDGTKWASHRYGRPTEQPGRYEIIPASEAPSIP